MRRVASNDQKALTPLEVVLQLHGEFRRSLESIRVTSLQAGVLLFLRRQAEAKIMDAAAALCVRPPTSTDVVKGLVRKRWVTKRRSVTDTRVVQLRLSRQGQAVTQKIEQRVCQLNVELIDQSEKP